MSWREFPYNRVDYIKSILKKKTDPTCNCLYDACMRKKQKRLAAELKEIQLKGNSEKTVKTVSLKTSESNYSNEAPLPVDHFISSYECGVLCEKVLDLLNASKLVLGLALDLPSQYNASLVKISSFHICYGENRCIFFKVDSMKTLPVAFKVLIQHENAQLVGNNIINDLHKIRRDFDLDTSHLIDEKVLKNPLDVNLHCDQHNWSLETNKPFSSDLVTPTISSQLKFNGKIHYLTNFPEIAAACEKLLTVAEALSEELVLGFDQEWPFSGSKTGKVSLMQICPNLEECYIFHLTGIKSLPKALVLLLRHPFIRITGLNIKNDIRKLCRDFNCDLIKILSFNVIELTTLANSVLRCYERWSLASLVLNQLGVSLSKERSIRCSNWAKQDLSEDQLMYAATDAYASLLCYQKLDAIRNSQCVKTNEANVALKI